MFPLVSNLAVKSKRDLTIPIPSRSFGMGYFKRIFDPVSLLLNFARRIVWEEVIGCLNLL